jgi:hypothetical protein
VTTNTIKKKKKSTQVSFHKISLTLYRPPPPTDNIYGKKTCKLDDLTEMTVVVKGASYNLLIIIMYGYRIHVIH